MPTGKGHQEREACDQLVNRQAGPTCNESYEFDIPSLDRLSHPLSLAKGVTPTAAPRVDVYELQEPGLGVVSADFYFSGGWSAFDDMAGATVAVELYGQGTRDLAEAQVKEFFDRLGARVRFTLHADYMRMRIKCRRMHAEDVISMALRCVAEPTFTDKALRKIIQLLVFRFKILEGETTYRARRELYQRIWDGESGYGQNLLESGHFAGVTREAVNRFHRDVLTLRQERIILCRSVGGEHQDQHSRAAWEYPAGVNVFLSGDYAPSLPERVVNLVEGMGLSVGESKNRYIRSLDDPRMNGHERNFIAYSGGAFLCGGEAPFEGQDISSDGLRSLASEAYDSFAPSDYWRLGGGVPGLLSPVRVDTPGSVQSSFIAGCMLPLCLARQPYFRHGVELLGGFMGSRLMQNLREHHGYTYGAWARVLEHRHGAALLIGAEVKQGSEVHCLEEVTRELDRLRTCRDDWWTDAEREQLQGHLLHRLLSDLDGSLRASRFLRRSVLRPWLGTPYAQASLKASRALSVEAMQGLLRNALCPENFTTVLAGDFGDADNG